MKANELRIGNWAYSPMTKSNFQISGLEKSREVTSLPIPLTEEWLKKLGFEIQAEIENIIFTISIQEYHLKKLIIFPYQNWWGVGFADYYTGKEKSETMPTQINYVHQLQNLYFALTGEELTTK